MIAWNRAARDRARRRSHADSRSGRPNRRDPASEPARPGTGLTPFVPQQRPPEPCRGCWRPGSRGPSRRCPTPPARSRPAIWDARATPPVTDDERTDLSDVVLLATGGFRGRHGRRLPTSVRWLGPKGRRRRSQRSLRRTDRVQGARLLGCGFDIPGHGRDYPEIGHLAGCARAPAGTTRRSSAARRRSGVRPPRQRRHAGASASSPLPCARDRARRPRKARTRRRAHRRPGLGLR